MLTVAASSGYWRHSAAVTHGGGEADMWDVIFDMAPTRPAEMMIYPAQNRLIGKAAKLAHAC